MPKPNIAEHQLTLVKTILTQFLPSGSEVWLFGSRATDHIKPYSDLDLFILFAERIDHKKITQCAYALEESSLPYKVDLADWRALSDRFKAIIKKKPHLLLFTVEPHEPSVQAPGSTQDDHLGKG